MLSNKNNQEIKRQDMRYIDNTDRSDDNNFAHYSLTSLPRSSPFECHINYIQCIYNGKVVPYSHWGDVVRVTCKGLFQCLY